MTRYNFLNINLDNLSMEETLAKIEQTIENKKQLLHVGVNASHIVDIQKDLVLRKSINDGDIINVDGQSVVWASRILNKPLKERVSGIDLMIRLVELAHKKSYKIFFFGAKEEIVKEVVKRYTKEYSKDMIAGYRNGYFKKEEEQSIAQEIADSGANILFVGISSPIKENFLFENRDTLKQVNLIMGVGGSFDVIAGFVKRAPIWMQKSGLEWLYRLIQEPKRMWKRYLIGNTKFVVLVLREKLKI